MNQYLLHTTHLMHSWHTYEFTTAVTWKSVASYQGSHHLNTKWIKALEFLPLPEGLLMAHVFFSDIRIDTLLMSHQIMSYSSPGRQLNWIQTHRIKQTEDMKGCRDFIEKGFRKSGRTDLSRRWEVKIQHINVWNCQRIMEESLKWTKQK